jgi:hypothetical protein
VLCSLDLVLTPPLRAGLSTIYPTSDVKIPTSAYSLSLNLASRVGFWDAGVS